MAIVLPLLLILTLGLMEYGWIFLKVSQINMSARHGVRTAIRPGATATEVQASVADMMLRHVGIKQTDYTLTYGWRDSGGTWHSDVDAPTGWPVTVHISVDYKKLSLTGASLIPVPDKVQGKGTMAKERAPS